MKGPPSSCNSRRSGAASSKASSSRFTRPAKWTPTRSPCGTARSAVAVGPIAPAKCTPAASAPSAPDMDQAERHEKQHGTGGFWHHDQNAVRDKQMHVPYQGRTEWRKIGQQEVTSAQAPRAVVRARVKGTRTDGSPVPEIDYIAKLGRGNVAVVEDLDEARS